MVFAMNNTLFAAIRKRRIVTFRYDQRVRWVEPYLYGVDAEGNDVLLAFQPGLGWQLFLVDEMTALALTEKAIGPPRPGYDPRDRRMVQLYARL